MPTYEQAKAQWQWEQSGRGNVHVSQANSGGAIFLLALVVLIPLILLFAAGLASESLPMTEHAKTSHAGQTWRADTIQAYMSSHQCQVKTYLCPSGVRVKYCEIKPGLSIGLFVGETVKQVISGFSARTEYWQSRDKACR